MIALVVYRFNTIKDDIDLKHHVHITIINFGFNTIKDDIDLKPQY